MKKIYSLLAVALVSASAVAQSAYIKDTKLMPERSNLQEKTPTDTAGWTNAGNFYPEFAVGGSVVSYGYTGGGYVYGNNADGYNVVAQGYLNANNDPVGIEEVILWGAGKYEMDATSTFDIKLYQMADNSAYGDDGAGNPALNSEGPSTLMHTETVNLSDLDTTWPNISIFPMSQVVAVGTGNFAISIDPADADSKGDTLGLISDQDGEGTMYAFHNVAGNWYVTDFAFGGLNNNIAMFAVVDQNFVGIDSENFYNGLQLSAFPNPASVNTTIAFNLERDFKEVNLEVMDASGRIVKNINFGTLSQGEYREVMSVSELPSGNYYYTIKADGHRLTKKFVVVK